MALTTKHVIGKKRGIASTESKPGGVGSCTGNHTKRLPVTSKRVYQLVPNNTQQHMWSLLGPLALSYFSSQVTFPASSYCLLSEVRSFINSFKQILSLTSGHDEDTQCDRHWTVVPYPRNEARHPDLHSREVAILHSSKWIINNRYFRITSIRRSDTLTRPFTPSRHSLYSHRHNYMPYAEVNPARPQPMSDA